jgi:hypothetical protein
MADKLLLENGAGGYLNENGVNIILLEAPAEGAFQGNAFQNNAFQVSASLGIENDPNSYAFGALAPSATSATGLSYFTITNSSSFAIDVTISCTDMTGGVTWTLADDGNPGANIYALKAGLDGGSYNVIVKKTAPYNELKSALAAAATQKFGITIYAPTSFSDGVGKTGTMTLTAAAA